MAGAMAVVMVKVVVLGVAAAAVVVAMVVTITYSNKILLVTKVKSDRCSSKSQESKIRVYSLHK